MKYFITGFTGSMAPCIVEEILLKDEAAFFYLAVRKGREGVDAFSRVKNTINLLTLDQKYKEQLLSQSKVIEIDVRDECMNIPAAQYEELIENVDKILHGAADVRFDQPLKKIKISNVDFSLAVLAFYHDVKNYRVSKGGTLPCLFHISTVFAYGKRRGLIKEDFPSFDSGEPENSYVETKSIVKKRMLKEILAGEQIVVFEPSIIGGSSKTGKIKNYTMFYFFLFLCFTNKLPFLSSKHNQLDIVPLDWVASVISDFMTQNASKESYKKGILRLVAGENAITNMQMKRLACNYYKEDLVYPECKVSKVRFLPDFVFYSIFYITKCILFLLYMRCRVKAFRRSYLALKTLEIYLPFVSGYKVFENTKSNELIKKHTHCKSAPILQDYVDENGVSRNGYFRVLLKDTIKTGFGGKLSSITVQNKVLK